MIDRVRICNSGTAADGELATVLRRERETVLVELDRQPVDWISRRAWFHVRQTEIVREAA